MHAALHWMYSIQMFSCKWMFYLWVSHNKTSNTAFSQTNYDVKNYTVFILPCLFVLDHFWVLFPDVLMVITSEVAVDVVKHAFITKFNDISADVSLLVLHYDYFVHTSI